MDIFSDKITLKCSWTTKNISIGILIQYFVINSGFLIKKNDFFNDFGASSYVVTTSLFEVEANGTHNLHSTPYWILSERLLFLNLHGLRMKWIKKNKYNQWKN